MTVTFRIDVPLEETMAFEYVYEDSLQVDTADKRDILEHGVAAWLYVDGVLAGETYGISPPLLDEEIEDCDDKDPRAVYCYSTTILPAFQGRGLSKVLKAFWLGQCKRAGYTKVIGHATNDGAVALNRFFGVTFSAVHERWYGTERSARFYELSI